MTTAPILWIISEVMGTRNVTFALAAVTSTPEVRHNDGMPNTFFFCNSTEESFAEFLLL